MLLPVVLISMQLMVNNPQIMGPHVNNKFQNIIGWSTTVILIILTLLLLVLPALDFFKAQLSKNFYSILADF